MKDLLFLAHRAPFPPDRGDKIRSYHVLRYLTERARVHLVAFGETAADRVPPPELAARLASWTIVRRAKSRALAAVQALASGTPISLTAFADPRLSEAVARIRAAHPITGTYIFSGQMAQYAGPERSIMDFVDVDSAKFAQLADGRHGPIRALLRREAHLLGRYERATAKRLDVSLFVTETEAALFRSGGGAGQVIAVENGIDSDYFDPSAKFERRVEAGPLITFTGQMDYSPNVEAVIRFATEILPAIRARHPRARFAIVGRSPTAPVRALAAREHVVVTGEVDDVRPWLAASEVAVAPLRLARGVQNKVLEAMAMARPVVASPAAAQGIDHAGTLRVADADFAEVVTALLDAPSAAAAFGQSARARVISRYGWKARLAPIAEVLGLESRLQSAA